jgi:hypothetical protein
MPLKIFLVAPTRRTDGLEKVGQNPDRQGTDRMSRPREPWGWPGVGCLVNNGIGESGKSRIAEGVYVADEVETGP